MAYVRAPATGLAVLEQEVISMNANTTLVELPAGDLGIALGYEHREESAFFETGGVTKLGLGGVFQSMLPRVLTKQTSGM